MSLVPSREQSSTSTISLRYGTAFTRVTISRMVLFSSKTGISTESKKFSRNGEGGGSGGMGRTEASSSTSRRLEACRSRDGAVDRLPRARRLFVGADVRAYELETKGRLPVAVAHLDYRPSSPLEPRLRDQHRQVSRARAR